VGWGLHHLSMGDLFWPFTRAQQSRLRAGASQDIPSGSTTLARILDLYGRESERALLRRALLDPYFPLAMVARTLFTDVDGMRFFIGKRRPEVEWFNLRELIRQAEAFVRLRTDIETFFDPMTVTCIPLDGQKHPLPDDQWCTLCGACCEIGGVPPEPPIGICYPGHWYTYLAGGAVDNQQLCPFLFQYFGEARFFCAIHRVKPVACREFDEEACRVRLREGGLHRGGARNLSPRRP
jgi:hypothetical protein